MGVTIGMGCKSEKRRYTRVGRLIVVCVEVGHEDMGLMEV